MGAWCASCLPSLFAAEVDMEFRAVRIEQPLLESNASTVLIRGSSLRVLAKIAEGKVRSSRCSAASRVVGRLRPAEFRREKRDIMGDPPLQAGRRYHGETSLPVRS